jgi:intein-encoded DNA endonuclease-like protein
MPAKIEQEVINKLITFYKNNNCTYKEASKHVGINRHIGAKYLRNNGFGRSKNNRRKYYQRQFEHINTEEKAYWLGFLYADGNVATTRHATSLGLALVDKDHVQKFADFVSKEHYKVKFDHFRARFNVGSKAMKKDLIRLGCVPRKSNILKFPDKNQVSKKFQRHFIRGYFDGDGCMSITLHANLHKKDRLSMTLGILGTHEFIRDLHQCVKINNAYIVLANKRSTANCYQATYKKDQTDFLLEYMYKDCNIYLKRKFDKVVKYCRFNEKSLKLLGSKYGEG